jgi:hypothetical protein
MFHNVTASVVQWSEFLAAGAEVRDMEGTGRGPMTVQSQYLPEKERENAQSEENIFQPRFEPGTYTILTEGTPPLRQPKF